jgi:hypothetical protein
VPLPPPPPGEDPTGEDPNCGVDPRARLLFDAINAMTVEFLDGADRRSKIAMQHLLRGKTADALTQAQLLRGEAADGRRSIAKKLDDWQKCNPGEKIPAALYAAYGNFVHKTSEYENIGRGLELFANALQQGQAWAKSAMDEVRIMLRDTGDEAQGLVKFLAVIAAALLGGGLNPAAQ